MSLLQKFPSKLISNTKNSKDIYPTPNFIAKSIHYNDMSDKKYGIVQFLSYYRLLKYINHFSWFELETDISLDLEFILVYTEKSRLAFAWKRILCQYHQYYLFGSAHFCNLLPCKFVKCTTHEFRQAQKRDAKKKGKIYKVK